MTFEVHRATGTPAELHALDLNVGGAPAIWVMEPSSGALVLGSAQPEESVNSERVAGAGLDVARRHSGGGAVLVRPGEMIWMDVLLARDDPRWIDDVIGSSVWLGAAMLSALEAVGCRGAVAHTGRLEKSPWAQICCFAALGPGEVTRNGRKILGISQRRTRDLARFQCSLLVGGDPAEVADYLVLDQREHDQLRSHLSDRAGTARVNSATFVAAVCDALNA